MSGYPEATKLFDFVKEANHILVIQADNPDADSLASSLALEEIFGEMGKTVSMYCSIDMPSYLRYLEGWDRVSNNLPNKYDLAILVDASTASLISKLDDPKFKSIIVNRPFIILDHHAIVQNSIDFSQLEITDDKRSSTGELIHILAKQVGWKLTVKACEFIMTSILGDTQGLTNKLASSDTYIIMSKLIDAGVDRVALEEKRRESSKMHESIYRYKARLIERTEFFHKNTIGVVVIPQTEIKTYSPLYNPAPLIQNDLLQVESMLLSIVFKTYDSGRVTAAIRANLKAPIANKLAEKMGGGGHDYASGFKIENGKKLSEIKSECIKFAIELIEQLDKE